MSPIRTRRALRLLTVLALPVAALVVGQSASASTTPPTVPGDSAPGPTIPDGYVRLVDGTGLLTVFVPETWTTVDTAPEALVAEGSIQPFIFASSVNRATFDDTFASGVLYASIPYTDDLETVIERGGLRRGCATIGGETVLEGTVPVDSVEADSVGPPGEPVPYVDPIFTGVVQVGENCGPNGGTWNMIVASPADKSFTAVVQLQIESPADQAAFDIVLQTFTYAGDPTVPPEVMVPSIPGSSVPA